MSHPFVTSSRFLRHTMLFTESENETLRVSSVGNNFYIVISSILRFHFVPLPRVDGWSTWYASCFTGDFNVSILLDVLCSVLRVWLFINRLEWTLIGLCRLPGARCCRFGCLLLPSGSQYGGYEMHCTAHFCKVFCIIYPGYAPCHPASR